MASIATANANRNGTGTLGTLKTGAADGTRCDFCVVKAIVTTTAGMIRFYIDDGAGNIFLWDELIVTAITASGTVAAFRGVIQLGFMLPVGYILKISTENAETFRCFVHGADY
jgi:hypothetical protein